MWDIVQKSTELEMKIIVPLKEWSAPHAQHAKLHCEKGLFHMQPEEWYSMD
jgi:hypothetical protein